MPMLLFTAASGWLVTSVFAGGSVLPWAVKRNPRSTFGWHFLIGYALPILALIHSWPSMAGGWARGANSTGLYAATLALGLMLPQLGLGIQLKELPGLKLRLRRVHLALMFAISALILLHISLNSFLVSRWLPS